MSRKLLIVLLLCVMVLGKSTVMAQFFAKQKVVVWAVMDRNNDVKVADATKTQIRTSIVDAFVNSRNYEAFEANINDVKARVGSAMSPINIAKAVKEMYGVDYVLFTSIKIVQHSSSYDNFQVHLSSDLFSAETQKSERMAYVDMKSDVKEIPGACAKLLSNLLCEQLSNSNQQPQQPSYQQSYQQPAYSQPVQPIEKTYKVGDLYDVNGRKGIVFVVTPDGKHGKMISINQTQSDWNTAKSWCSNLGNGWKLPTKGELSAMAKQGEKLNSILEAIGDVLYNAGYWSSDERNTDYAEYANGLYGGGASYRKSSNLYVRAVCAF